MDKSKQTTSMNLASQKKETEFHFTSTAGTFEYTFAANHPAQITPAKREIENVKLTYLKVMASRQETLWGVLRSRFSGKNDFGVRAFVNILRIIAGRFFSEKLLSLLFGDLDTEEPTEKSCEELPPLPPLPMELSSEELMFPDAVGKSMYLSLKKVFCPTVSECVFDDFVRHLMNCNTQETVYFCIMYYLGVYPRLHELESWKDVKFLEQLCSLIDGKLEVFNCKNLRRRIFRNMSSV